LARTVVRRAERTGWAAASVFGNRPATAERPGGVNLLALAYLNRLSDLLFILARAAGQGAPEVLWVPGKDRLAPDAKAARLRTKVTATDQPGGASQERAADPLASTEPIEPAQPQTETASAPDGPTPGIADQQSADDRENTEQD
jgi:cob(I)alamin adenosyltransferase